MISEGDYVIFEKAKFMKIFPVKKDKQFMIDRNKTKLNNLIDQPFGYQYEIKAQQLFLKSNEIIEKSAIEIKSDNRSLLDSSSNQKLSREEIMAMRDRDGLGGAEIVDKLIENSASFSGKTEYSQQKYIKKKKEKYLAQYAILKPSIRNLCQYYTQGHNKKKILNMRMDTIAQILTYSNVAAFRNVMVLESCKGLLLAAITERVGGFGKIVNFSPNGSHNAHTDTLNYMNFPSEFTDQLYNFPLEKAHRTEDYVTELANKVEISTDNEHYRKRKEGQLEKAKIVNDLFKNQQMDCLVIATKFRPLPILEKVIDYLGSNRYFVIYSATQEPLIECHSFLKVSQKATHMELSDSWLREYQILPERTHPTVMMDCHGGFLLTGITVNT